MYTTHTRTHTFFFLISFLPHNCCSRLSSANVLFVSASGSVGLIKLTSRLTSIQENIFMNACVHLPRQLTLQFFALKQPKQRQQKKARTQTQKTKYIYNLSGCVHRQITQPRDLINLRMLTLISVFLHSSLSKLPVSSSIVHIPKPNSYISFSKNDHLFLTSVFSAHLYALFKTLNRLTSGTTETDSRVQIVNYHYAQENPKPWLTPLTILLYTQEQPHFKRPSASFLFSQTKPSLSHTT